MKNFGLLNVANITVGLGKIAEHGNNTENDESVLKKVGVKNGLEVFLSTLIY